MYRILTPTLFWMFAATLGIVSARGAELDSLLTTVPADANALVIVNGQGIRQSKWYANAVKLLGSPSRSASVMPSAGVTAAVSAARLEFPGFRPVWETSAIDMAAPVSVELAAKNFGGKLESLGPAQAAWLPGDTYLFQLSNNRLGVASYGNRQFAARWLRKATDTPARVELSPYLTEAADYARKVGTEIVLALDLQDLVSAAEIREKVAASPAVTAAQANVESLAGLLADIRGVTLGIRFGEQINGKLRIDFSHDASAQASLAKPLVQEILRNQGAELEDLERWTLESSGNAIFLGGEMSPRSVRQVLSIVDPPQAQPPQYGQQSAELSKEAVASLNYFHSLQDLLTDLSKPNGEIITRGQYAMWLDRYARKLDALPVLNVDADLLFLSAEVATRLRSLGGQNKMVGINAGTASANNAASYNYAYTYNTCVWWKNTGLSEQQKSKQLGTAAAATSEVEQRQAIAGGMAAMRKQLTQKYQVEF